MAGHDEVLLRGDFTNAGRVVRVGDTVRRPGRPTTAATGALLEHLEAWDSTVRPAFAASTTPVAKSSPTSRATSRSTRACRGR
jgi:hypothetical protein